MEDTLVGLLMRGKKRVLVFYEGDMLLQVDRINNSWMSLIFDQGQHDDVCIVSLV